MQIRQDGKTLLLLRQVHEPQPGKPAAVSVVVGVAQFSSPALSRQEGRECQEVRPFCLRRSIESCSQRTDGLCVEVAGWTEPVPGQVLEHRCIAIKGNRMVQSHQLIARLQQAYTVLLGRSGTTPRVHVVGQVYDVRRARLNSQR